MANPSFNTDWRDKAAPAGYFKREWNLHSVFSEKGYNI